MLAPVSWLKDFVDITQDAQNLSWKLTELGLGVECINKIGADEIFELEITPNRPDLLSIAGIAREIAAIEEKKFHLKSVQLPQASKNLPIIIKNNFSLFERYCSVIIDNIKIKPSPKWLSDRLILIGLRPINNIVDITNYVMFELGIPLHAFDYNQIQGHEINVIQAEGGEDFTSVDELTYKLPKGAIIIKDKNRIIDLCGIKGGLNSGITDSTKTVYLQVTADDPYLIRKASQSLSLRSDASAIFERGVDKGGIPDSLKRAAGLILDQAGGEIASPIYDYSQKPFIPWSLNLRIPRLYKTLGYEISTKKVLSILKNLDLNPEIKNDIITVKVPTYRNDLQIEEDIIEEVARVYGYNNFPLTLISSPVPAQKAAYYKDFVTEKKVKQLLVSSGFNEIYSYSLIGPDQLNNLGIPEKSAIKISNPVSLEYQYLRPTILGNLIYALKFNQVNFRSFRLFELGRIYEGTPPDTRENLKLSMAVSRNNYSGLKGIIEELLERLNIKNVKFIPAVNTRLDNEYSPFNPAKSALVNAGPVNIGIIGELKSRLISDFELKIYPVLCQLDFEALEKLCGTAKYIPVSSTPALVEDLTLIIPGQIYMTQIIEEIKKITPLIKNITLRDSFNKTKTFSLTYHDPARSLSSADIKEYRQKILDRLNEKFGIKLKT